MTTFTSKLTLFGRSIPFTLGLFVTSIPLTIVHAAVLDQAFVLQITPITGGILGTFLLVIINGAVQVYAKAGFL